LQCVFGPDSSRAAGCAPALTPATPAPLNGNATADAA
jgi:hypothetical protein